MAPKKSKDPKAAQEEDEIARMQYPAGEDIYSQEKKEGLKEDEIPLSGDLDVPGAELDDRDEAVGEEDEENNYYSLGGDDHNDLDEDKGE